MNKNENVYDFPEFYFEIDEYTKDLENNKYFQSVTKHDFIPYGAEMWEDDNKKLICISIVYNGFDYECDQIVSPITDSYFDDPNKMKSLLTFITPVSVEEPTLDDVKRCLNYLVSANVLINHTDVCRCRFDFLEEDYQKLLRIIIIAQEDDNKYFETSIEFK